MTVNVKRMGDKTWIEGIPALRWARGKDTTYFGALEAALMVTDRPYGYEELMGYSGHAFRMRWFRGDNGQRGSTSCFVGEGSSIEQATGWRVDSKVAGLIETYHNKLDMERFAPDIMATIDAGLPALAYEPNWNVSVLRGYADEGRRVFLVDYFHPECDTELNTSDLIPSLSFLEDAGEPPPRDVAVCEAVKLAVHNWHRGPVRCDYNIGHYASGRAAFEMWQEDVTFWATSAENPRESGFTDGWTMSGLLDARAAAIPFLRSHSSLLGEKAAAALERAADLYEEELRLLWVDAPGSRNVENFARFLEDLNSKNARDFCQFLEDLCTIESQAIAEMETAIEESR